MFTIGMIVGFCIGVFVPVGVKTAVIELLGKAWNGIMGLIKKNETPKA